MKILAIIPAFNEEENIRSVLKKIRGLKPNIDVVVINDCSTDNTCSEAEKLDANVINLPVNLGIGGAVQTGYMYAHANGYDIAIQVDGDGQHDPEYIPMLLKPIIEDKFDLVIGSRFLGKSKFKSTFLRRIGIGILNILIFLMTFKKISDCTSGFRACNKKLIEIFQNKYPVDYPEPESIIIAQKFKMKITEVPVNMSERIGGKSSIKFIHSIYYMIKVSLAIIIDKFKKY